MYNTSKEVIICFFSVFETGGVNFFSSTNVTLWKESKMIPLLKTTYIIDMARLCI